MKDDEEYHRRFWGRMAFWFQLGRLGVFVGPSTRYDAMGRYQWPYSDEYTLRHVLALIRSLKCGILGRTIRQAHEAFESGTDLDEETLLLMSHTFEIRMMLTEALQTLSGKGLDIREASQALMEADEAHAEHTSAILMVADTWDGPYAYWADVYGVTFDLNVWWGTYERLERTVPPGVIEGALAALATK